MAITKQGLTAIALLVALLWGCLIAERVIVQRANQEMGRMLKNRKPAVFPPTEQKLQRELDHPRTA